MTINLSALSAALKRLNKFYEEREERGMSWKYELGKFLTEIGYEPDAGEVDTQSTMCECCNNPAWVNRNGQILCKECLTLQVKKEKDGHE